MQCWAKLSYSTWSGWLCVCDIFLGNMNKMVLSQGHEHSEKTKREEKNNVSSFELLQVIGRIAILKREAAQRAKRSSLLFFSSLLLFSLFLWYFSCLPACSPVTGHTHAQGFTRYYTRYGILSSTSYYPSTVLMHMHDTSMIVLSSNCVYDGHLNDSWHIRHSLRHTADNTGNTWGFLRTE